MLQCSAVCCSHVIQWFVFVIRGRLIGWSSAVVPSNKALNRISLVTIQLRRLITSERASVSGIRYKFKIKSSDSGLFLFLLYSVCVLL